MEKNDINCKTKLSENDTDFSEDKRYYSENNENEKMKCEFLDAISQMLIYYKNREKSDNE